MTRVSTNKMERAIFGERFSKKFKEWQSKEAGRTQTSFGQLLDPSASRGSVMKWCNGTNIPTPERIRQICEIFEVSEDYFNTDNATHDEQYRLSSKYMTDLAKQEIIQACKEDIGLDIQFLKALRGLIGSDFEEIFPFWTPIVIKPGTWNVFDLARSGKFCEYEHGDLSYLETSAPMENELKQIFQAEVDVEEDGKTEHRLITLSGADLLFLRDVQEDVKDYIEFLFLKRKKEMKREGEEATKKTARHLPDGGVTLCRVKDEDLNKIDRYFDGYSDSKEEADQKNNR